MKKNKSWLGTQIESSDNFAWGFAAVVVGILVAIAIL